jgi:two-component system sensor histidine kinase KdpD
LVPFRGAELNLVSDMLLFLLITVVVALVGGLAPALVAAIAGSVLLNYFFTPPYHTLTIRDTNNALALFVFIAVALLVSSAVDAAARRTRQAARAASESRILAGLAGSVLGGEEALQQMLERTRETFSLASVTLFEMNDDGWDPVASAGPPCATPGEADTKLPAGNGRVLALRGGLIEAEDQRLIGAFAAQVGLVRERIQLTDEAAEAAPLAAADRMRTALLAAVGHDLRTPLAAAKASISSLLSSDVHLAENDRRELLVTANESLDRLTGLVENLLDMSRLQAGALSLHMEPIRIDEVVARALDDLGADGSPVLVDLPEDLPRVYADPGLLERVLANLVANAQRFSPAAHPPLITASKLGDRVEVRVVDRGPGLPEADRERVFLAFQRLGDTDNTTGVGLGLALSRGLTEAMHGVLEPEETPGGGLTMVVALEAASGGGQA